MPEVSCGPVRGQPRYSQGHTRLMGYGLFPKTYFLAQFKRASFAKGDAFCPGAILLILWL